jgi:hypothetical protein
MTSTTLEVHSTLAVMSSDPFADLASSLEAFAWALRDVLVVNDYPAQGSPAAREGEGEPYAGEWSAHPARDLNASVLLATWSCADHLAALSVVLRARKLITPLYTIARGAAESAAVACYLTQTDIDPLERVRRNMNYNLQALTEDLNMLRRFTSPDAVARIRRHEEQLAKIAREGQLKSFAFTKPKRYNAGYLGDKPPSAMDTISKIASQSPVIGAASQQLLSGVAHAQLHGLSRFLMTIGPEPDDPSKVTVTLNVAAPELAMNLLVAPLCALTLVEHIRWFLGWDVDDARAMGKRLLYTWVRIAGIPTAKIEAG